MGIQKYVCKCRRLNRTTFREKVDFKLAWSLAHDGAGLGKKKGVSERS